MKKQIYRNTSLILFSLFAFVSLQIFLMFPRKILYGDSFFKNDNLYINIDNTNYRMLRLKLKISDRVIRKNIEKRSKDVVKIGKVRGGVISLDDNYGNNVVYDFNR